jgi:hypothetical protein
MRGILRLSQVYQTELSVVWHKRENEQIVASHCLLLFVKGKQNRRLLHLCSSRPAERKEKIQAYVRALLRQFPLFAPALRSNHKQIRPPASAFHGIRTSGRLHASYITLDS